MYWHLLRDEFLGDVHLIQIHGAQNCSCMCMCIEFVIQVPKQKNAHVSSPAAMLKSIGRVLSLLNVLERRAFSGILPEFGIRNVTQIAFHKQWFGQRAHP